MLNAFGKEDSGYSSLKIPNWLRKPAHRDFSGEPL